MMKKLLLICIVIMSVFTRAQPFTLKSVGEPKEFSLQIYYGRAGKGAFVQYKGQKGIIPLQIKSVTTDSTGRSDGQPDFTSYVWDEMADGKVNGTYRLTEGLRQISDVSYERKKDGKKFKLVMTEDKSEVYDGVNKYFLNGVMISFNHFYSDDLSFKYADGSYFTTILPSIDNPDAARQSIIDDYNFDGYDDIAFSIPDAGMGVYRTFTIWLYNPAVKRFEELKEPDYSQSQCSCLCDVSIDKSKKLLNTGCRGGARWWQDTYRFGKNGTLKWVHSKEETEK
ncbi:hypothetical protein N6B72_14655 [Chryseobacterium soli]|uniref:XAC2610-related protein n=1 Tax=Chryseobacterium soli TaxID=445961 RepID=UPI002953ED34|nr:hypothetical protein [Chryseobacterium soli]MDV7698164.1 hypothetical protein [Chryseobacterium soli]